MWPYASVFSPPQPLPLPRPGCLAGGDVGGGAVHKASRYGQEGGHLSWPGDDLEFLARLIGVARGVGLWVERS